MQTTPLSLPRRSWLESYAVDCADCDGITECVCDDEIRCRDCGEYHRPSEDCPTLQNRRTA